MTVLRLHNVKVIPRPTPHRQLPDDLCLVAKILVGTHAVASSEETWMDPSGGFWMLKLRSDIPSENGFSVQISGRCLNETLPFPYGSIQVDARDVMRKADSRGRYTLERNLDQQTDDSLSFQLRIDFSIDSNSGLQNSAAGVLHLDEDSIANLLQSAIQGGSEKVKSQDLSVVYKSIQQIPQANRNRSLLLNRLGDVYLRNYNNTQSVDDLNEAVNAYYRATLRTDPRTNNYSADLGDVLRIRFARLGDLNDIKQSVSRLEEVLQLTPDGHRDKPSLLNKLGNSLLSRFERLGDLNDINQSVSRFEEAVELTPDGHPDKPSRLNNLGNSLLRRFERLGDLNDINQSVSRLEEAVQLTQDDHPDKPSLLNNLGNSLLRRFELLEDLNDLNHSVLRFEEALQLTPDNHPDKPTKLNNLGSSLLDRFERLGDLTDINQSILRCEEAVQLTQDGHPDKPSWLNNLGTSLLRRSEHLGNLDDLIRSVSIFEEAVRLTPDDHPDKPSLLNNLGNSLLRRFVRQGDPNDLNHSVWRCEKAVHLTPDGHPNKPSRLNHLGTSLLWRFEHLGDLNDINQSVSRFEEAVEVTPDGHHNKPSRLNNLGTSLLRRFERLGDLRDINQSVSMFEEAVQLTPDGHPDKASRVNILGNALLRRFERLRDPNDIDQSVSRSKEAVQLTPDGHPVKPTRLNNLGDSLLRRFEWLGDLTDINHSVSRFEEAVRLTPGGHPDKPAWLNSLGNSLLRRFERLGDLNDINQSVSCSEEAVRLTPDRHSDKPAWLNSLGNSHLRRFELLGELNDINQSVSRFEEAVRLTPDGHPDKSSRLNNLGNSLLDRFERHRGLNDLNQSILRFEEAVRLTPDRHPLKPLRLNNLGTSLWRRFESLLELNDIENAIQLYSASALSIAGPATARLYAAFMWARLAAHFTAPSMIYAYTTAMHLLPDISWQGLTMGERQYHLLKAGAIVRDAVSAAIEAEDFSKAVEWLDQGRSVIWSQFCDLQTNHDLKLNYPDFANRLTTLSKELEGSRKRHIVDVDFKVNRVLEPDPMTISQRYYELAHQREELLTSIRNLKGFDRFLLPRNLAQLQAAAKDRMVIFVNISKQRCDALILIPDVDNVLHAPLNNFDLHTAEELHGALQDLLVAKLKGCCISELGDNESNWVPPQFPFGPQEPDLERIAAKSRSSRDDNRKLQLVSASEHEHRVDPEVQFRWILKELWVRVVKPILEALAFPEDKRDHELPSISWCLTGPLTFLPIHAAGIYEDRTGPKLSSYAISSYIPTLSNLLPRSQSMPAQKPQVLAVALPFESKLKDTDVEVSMVTDAASGLVDSIVLMDNAATADEVAECMKKASFVHFACCGCQNLTNPTQSAFLLAKRSSLTLERISQLHLPNAELAFLSACQMATADEKLAGEAVHLPAGMLLAGYRGVVATLWSTQDNHVPIVADVFYREVFNKSNPDATHAARALHKAVEKLKDEVGESSFLSWVPFIHMGV